MRTLHALLALGGVGLFVGFSGLALSDAGNKIQSCENQLNSVLLQQVIGFEQATDTNMKIANAAILLKLDKMANSQDASKIAMMRPLLEKAIELNGKLSENNDNWANLVEDSCNAQRSNWLLLSFITMLVGVFSSCFGFWIGLRVNHEVRPGFVQQKVENA